MERERERERERKKNVLVVPTSVGTIHILFGFLMAGSFPQRWPSDGSCCSRIPVSSGPETIALRDRNLDPQFLRSLRRKRRGVAGSPASLCDRLACAGSRRELFEFQGLLNYQKMHVISLCSCGPKVGRREKAVWCRCSHFPEN